MPPDPLVHAFNLIRLPAADDAGEARRLVRGQLGRVRADPGRGRDALPGQRPAHVGCRPARAPRPAFERLEAAQRAFDPDDVITPGYEVF
jgi:hypothetical protein